MHESCPERYNMHDAWNNMHESSLKGYNMKESFPVLYGHAQINLDMHSGSSIFTLFWWWLVYVHVVERKIQVRKFEYYILLYIFITCQYA